MSLNFIPSRLLLSTVLLISSILSTVISYCNISDMTDFISATNPVFDILPLKNRSSFLCCSNILLTIRFFPVSSRTG